MALGLTLGMLTILSCGDDDDDAIELQANLRGANEVPVANSPGSGTAELTINDDQTQISYVLTYTGLSNVAQGHIHVGDANINGPIILFLCANGALVNNAPVPPPSCPAGSGTVTGTLTSANLILRPQNTPAINSFADAITQILNGNTYTNVHTDDGVPPPNTGPGDFPGGEIRGQNVQ
jgi:hypothetical protein